MPFCYFSKAKKGISWSEIKTNTLLQTANRCKKTEYQELAVIMVPKEEFDIMCEDVSAPNPCYQKHAFKSIAGENGVWRCIILQNKYNMHKIILYTSGRTYPLYVAIEEPK